MRRLLRISRILLLAVSVAVVTSQQVGAPTPSNFPPVLQVSSSEGYLPETAEIGTTVRVSANLHSESLQILVTDDDLKPGMAPATYQYILTGLGATVFAVDQRGYVYLNVPQIDADPPSPSTYQLNVQAREVNTVPVRSSQPISLTIHIIDANDNAPLFQSQVFTANVSPVGGRRPVLRLSAVDIDAGRFGQVRYHIASVTGGAENLFDYDNSTSTLMATGPLSPASSYQVILEAADGGGKTAQALVVVSTGNEDGSATTVGQPTTPGRTFVTEVNEATPPNSVVVSLGDASTRGSVTYEIVSGNEEGRFQINPDSGTISTVLPFDRETTGSFRLTVLAQPRRPGIAPATTVVEVAVQDVNDNAPKFLGPKPLVFEVSPATMPNQIIGRVLVEDDDSGSNGRVTMEIEPPANQYFTLGADGVLRINGPPPPTSQGYFELTVIASDGGDPPLETRGQVVINVVQSTSQSTSSTRPTQPGSTGSTSRPSSSAPFPVPQTPFTVPSSPTTQTTRQPTVPGSSMTSTGTTGSGTTGAPTREPPVFEKSQVEVSVPENEMPKILTDLVARYSNNQPGPISYVLKQGDPTLFGVDGLTGRLRTLKPLDAELETSHVVIISTEQAEVETAVKYPGQFYSVTVMVTVTDVNDWIPNFEPQSYTATVPSDVQPGSILSQVEAFDQDLTAPNNVVTYRLTSAGLDNIQQYFNVNPRTGLITVSRSLDSLPETDIVLYVEASDGGTPPLTSQATVAVQIQPVQSAIIPENTDSFTSSPQNGQIQFSLRNYTYSYSFFDFPSQFSPSSFSTSVSEGVRPPFFVQILPVANKPADTRFVYCNIASGNYGGAFTVTAGADGNCELRTQVQLDRESIERYLLNVTVSASGLTDFALVSVTVLDINDNAPEFIFNNDLGLTMYFAGVSSTAPPFSRVLLVKAEDPDLGNSSVVQYKLDPLSVDAKYFSINSGIGEILTKQSMGQVIGKRQPYFELRVEAKDSPPTGKPMTARADVIVNVISDQNRFLMTARGIQPEQLRAHEQDIIQSMRPYTGQCTLISVEKMIENRQMADSEQTGTDVYWYAVNPNTKKICKKADFRNLFSSDASALIAGKMQPWFVLDKLTDRTAGYDVETAGDGEGFGGRWRAAPIALIVLAGVIALGALLGIIALCLFWSRYKVNRHTVHDYPSMYPVPKFGTLFLPGAPSEKIYETQMLEMPITDDDYGTKNGHLHHNGHMSNSRHSHGEEGDFSIEESMYAINQPGRIDPFTQRIQTLVIPPPDYPLHGLASQKSVL